MNVERVTGYAVAAWLLARGFLRPKPRPIDLPGRLAMLPRTAPTKAALRIHMNAHQIPFIEAESDDDLAVGLGIVHAHLRLAQMEIMRRLAQGRVAEMAGPLGLPLDRALRLIDFPRAVPAIIAGMSAEVRAWGEGFVRGVNHVLMHGEAPYEFGLLGIGREPWTLYDLTANARLAAADVNWLVWGRLLKARRGMPEARWRAIWPRLLAGGAPNPEDVLPMLGARVGSNAAVAGGTRTRSGAGLLAADPHLSIALPNVWLACGMASPGINVAGLMPTGFPIVAIGRNRHLAWAGTSLHHAASDLFDARGLAITEREVEVKTRIAGRRRLTLRESPIGPIVSDGILMHNDTPLALRWMGHRATDEMGAMFGVMRAETPDAFAGALRDFAIPGQNMLHATRDGRIGHLLACASPRRPGLPDDIVRPPEAAAYWDSFALTPEYPDRRDPNEGIFVSANDTPPPTVVPAGYLFSPSDRAERLRAMLGEGTLGLADMAATQTDTLGRTTTARALAAALPEHPAAARLRDWDGRYDAESAGALLYEATLASLIRSLPDQDEVGAVAAVWQGRPMLAEAILGQDPTDLRRHLQTAFDEALRLVERHGSWGHVHQLRLRHYLGAIPVLGRRFHYGAFPSPGGNDTLNKTGHPPVSGPHAVSYGASARFLADMAEPDGNRVVLLGGQDGWLGSSTFLDQAALWQRGDSIDLPLRPETARQWPHHLELTPA